MQYRCRTGYVYSTPTLLAAQIGRRRRGARDLATTHTALEEAADLASRMASRARERGDQRIAERYARQAAVLACRVDAVLEAIQQDFGDGDTSDPSR